MNLTIARILKKVENLLILNILKYGKLSEQ